MAEVVAARQVQHVSVQGKHQSTQYTVPAEWEPLKNLGSGAYATVAAFRGPPSSGGGSGGALFAVKKLEGVLDHPILALRTLREVRLLAHFNHPNLLSIQEFFLDSNVFKDVYLRLEMMDGDLHQLIYGSKLADRQVQWVLYQTLRGLLCLKTAQVLHRDLKPGNILVKAAGDVKIADLGLSRTIDAEDDGQDHEVLTEYVVTRYYRAPEVVLTATHYTYAVDMWSTGCILGEMFKRRPLFQGKDSLDQIRQIVIVSGAQTADEMSWLTPNSPSWKFVEKCNQSANGEAFQKLLRSPDLNPLGTDLLAQMLRFDPSRRITVDDCLHHGYLKDFDADGDPEVAAARAVRPVDWSFDRDLCFEADGGVRPYNPEAFRNAFFETRRMVDASSGSPGAASPAGCASPQPARTAAAASVAAGTEAQRGGGQGQAVAAAAGAAGAAGEEPSPPKRWGRRWRQNGSGGAPGADGVASG